MLDLHQIRAQFPALESPTVFLDNPGGTQIARQSLERIQSYLVNTNANHGGAFETSRQSDILAETAHAAMADFLNASRPEEIIFGPNMTTLTFSMSRALARTFNPGDTLVVTRLDHDANISPWLLAAEDRGCKIRWVDFNPEDCTLNLNDLEAALEEKPRLVAVGYASNATGTINPVRTITRMAHEAGALVYVDAVQYAAHGPIDVQNIGCDFLACSSYKFFGPHMGILYGRYDLLEELRAYKVRPAPALPPGKFETGTGNFEGMAGVLGALEYFEWLGVTFGQEQAEALSSSYHGRKLIFKQAMKALRAYEFELNRAILQALEEIPGLTLYGIKDPLNLESRLATFSFTIRGLAPRQITEHAGRQGINLWDGNYYALAVTERLGLEGKGGMVRIGAVHYNTLEEINRFKQMLRGLTAADFSTRIAARLFAGDH
ncbi:MAG TPA: cysteine desulfurase-like protein [Anaerolineaceae bacterium]|nr:cysteine desulfurase-like protein [Anaerolineaceae bacterium]HPN50450.1 cysteine desulfurase-like protein [Anaerolineaceae bacterium]